MGKHSHFFHEMKKIPGGRKCCLWKSGISTLVWGKYSKDPCMGDCGVLIWFMHVGAFPWVSNFPSPFILPWKNFNCVLNKPNQICVQCFCFILKLSPLESALVAARLKWLQALEQERWCKQFWRVRYSMGKRKRERKCFFVPLWLYKLRFGTDQVLFQNDQSTSHAFVCFWWAHCLVRLTGFFDHTPAPTPS